MLISLSKIMKTQSRLMNYGAGKGNCQYHPYDKMNLYCTACKLFTCQSCKAQKHNKHRVISAAAFKKSHNNNRDQHYETKTQVGQQDSTWQKILKAAPASELMQTRLSDLQEQRRRDIEDQKSSIILQSNYFH